ncbi:CrcB-like protein [Novymonas esmeraldas]|uniref:CrcB-like protein n=1 Tax=Novymonas esmeraldas TaxID=1808958 RepID=A0AAW0EZJ8_9TRYP
MPVVFLLWGRDGGRALRWCGAWALGHRLTAWESCNALLRAVDLASAALLVLASILAPVLVQVHITSGRIRTIFTDDVRMVVLAPAGAVPRYLLSVYLNKRAGVAQFPLGTLAANLLGVLLAIVLYDMELVHPSNAWYVMVQQGICGALSTVSSLVNELVGFYGGGRASFAYLYALVSVGVGIFIAGVGRPQIYGRSGA